MDIHNFLNSLSGPRIVSLKTKTPVKLLVSSKEKFPLGISKVSTMNGIIGANYESATNKGIARNFEGNIEEMPYFEAESLWRGKGKNVTKFLVEHTETKEQYLKFLPNLKNRPVTFYVDNATEQVVTPEDFAEFEGKKSDNPNVGGIKWRVITLSNILDIR